MRIYLQDENDTVRVYFKERKMYLVADAVTLVTILGGAVMVAKQRKKRKASKKAMRAETRANSRNVVARTSRARSVKKRA